MYSNGFEANSNIEELSRLHIICPLWGSIKLKCVNGNGHIHIVRAINVNSQKG